MRICHNSRKNEYRSPFGAACCGSTVKLSVKVFGDCAPDSVLVRLWQDEERFVPMTCIGNDGEGFLYSAHVELPQEPCLLWYYFVAEKDGRSVFCCKGFGGEGETLEYCNESSWQITVFHKDFKTPEWFKGTVMYQIFPDRFFRKGEICEIPERNSEYIIHEDWYEPVLFNRHPVENGPACNDFFGGNLQGIIEKLPYLKELGIGVLYLNPIFEAFSNHRYDTGDYSKIDPVLGTEEDFRELCSRCEEQGIRIILDGVFSHTGSDSIYFNKYGNYGDNTGAYRDLNSPFRSWYQWCEGGYQSWWGCSNLPNVNETEPTYVDYILRNEDAIIKKWLRAGAFGWRLDVADELPDEFIKILRREVKAENPEAVIIGEVWEDASNKESYGKRREYLLGDELDSVMNYPFKDSVIGFLSEKIEAEAFAENLETIMEHYPAESLYSAMNLLGTHDTVRVKSLLGGQYTDENMSNEQKQCFRLEPKNETLALKRLRLAAFLQMTFVGVPCIYYGDEIGMQGLSDPFNRMPFTWRCADNELLEYYRKLTGLRNSLDCLKTGSFETVAARGGVFAFVRKIEKGKDVFGKKAKDGLALCIVNRNPHPERVEICGDLSASAIGLISGAKIVSEKGKLFADMPSFSAELFFNR